MKHRHKFKNKFINKNQSLKYQIMLFLMEEHKRARLGITPYYGEYFGDDSLIFEDKEWIKICEIIERLISKNHKELIKKIKKVMTIDEYIISLIENSNYCYNFTYHEDTHLRIFEITPNGYSYQFNGYIKSSDKSNLIGNKLNKWIMVFTGITTIYYLCSWFVPNLNFSNFSNYVNFTLKFINSISFEFFKFILLIFLNLFLIIKTAEFLKIKIDNKK